MRTITNSKPLWKSGKRWGFQCWRQEGGAGHKVRTPSGERWVYTEQLLGQRWMGVGILDLSIFFKSIGTEAQPQISSIQNTDCSCRDTQASFSWFFSIPLWSPQCDLICQRCDYIQHGFYLTVTWNLFCSSASLSIQPLLFWRFVFHFFFSQKDQVLENWVFRKLWKILHQCGVSHLSRSQVDTMWWGWRPSLSYVWVTQKMSFPAHGTLTPTFTILIYSIIQEIWELRRVRTQW